MWENGTVGTGFAQGVALGLAFRKALYYVRPMPMTPLDRKVILLQKGVTLDAIARKLRRKRSISTISRVIAGRQYRQGEEIRKVTAQLVGVSLAQMFG